jgi:transcription elongation factor Elf1
MSKLDLNCPHCGQSVIKSYDKEVKCRTKLLKWDSNGMFAICKSCNHDVPITVELIKSIQSTFVFETKKD